jgi:anti-anti-sigma factor
MQVTDSSLREIDHASAPAFLAAMCEMIDWADNRAVVVDCSSITFLDSSGFHAFMDAHEYAIERDHLLVIYGLAENCARVVRICDPDHVLTMAEPQVVG